MGVYVTCEGTKLMAECPQELLEKLYEAEPVCATLLEQFTKKSIYPQKLKKINS